jgi:hypothetical protein
VKKRLPDLDESRPVEIIKEGVNTGVMVKLLPENGIIISGLKAEWPPWVKLEPNEKRISISLDGKSWEDRSDAEDLWFLGTLDPRTHLQDIRGIYPPSFLKAELSPEALKTTIEGLGSEAPSVSFDFPYSGERLTLKFSTTVES